MGESEGSCMRAPLSACGRSDPAEWGARSVGERTQSTCVRVRRTHDWIEGQPFGLVGERLPSR